MTDTLIARAAALEAVVTPLADGRLWVARPTGYASAMPPDALAGMVDDIERRITEDAAQTARRAKQRAKATTPVRSCAAQLEILL